MIILECLDKKIPFTMKFCNLKSIQKTEKYKKYDKLFIKVCNSQWVKSKKIFKKNKEKNLSINSNATMK